MKVYLLLKILVWSAYKMFSILLYTIKTKVNESTFKINGLIASDQDGCSTSLCCLLSAPGDLMSQGFGIQASSSLVPTGTIDSFGTDVKLLYWLCLNV